MTFVLICIFLQSKIYLMSIFVYRKRKTQLPDDDQIVGPFTASDAVSPIPNIVEEVIVAANANKESMASTSRNVQSPSSAALKAENYFLKQELEEANQKLKNLTSRFSYEHIKNNDSQILMYTGIPSNALFLILVETIDDFKIKYYAGWNVILLPKVDQIVMTLMKLRLNLPHKDLGLRFNCSTSTVTNIVMTWIYAMHSFFFEEMMKTIPSRKKK